ncbi:hypothetical protein KVT40_004620 [Elsinoe batatas]|uniref:Uncharacterized protein n=1 Tax=Elsinoe batatas TaxID=2601811 RepID=A0A8K0PG27_9PEZI|nr:hypothetical protein KVT40_004620 [Elsinoe batatas]
MIAPQLTFTNTDRNFPARIRGLHRLGQQGIRRAMTFARTDATPAALDDSLLGADLASGLRPNSQASVLSLTSISAWNRTSMLSTSEAQSLNVEYRLHCPSTPASPRSSLSSDGSSISTIDACITKVDSSRPDAAAFEVASTTHGLIPPMKRFAFPSSTPLAQEAWPVFVNRVLQAESCQPIGPRRLSSFELNSPNASDSEDEIKSDGPFKFSERDWLDMEEAVLEDAQAIKKTPIKAVKKGEVKLVNVPKPTATHKMTTPAYQRKSFSTPELAVTTSIMDLLDKIVTRSRSVNGLRHDSLPYQPYSQPFDPFNESPVSDGEPPTDSLTKAERRKCSIVQSSNNIELHLPPSSEVITAKPVNNPLPAAADINRMSWFDASDSHPVVVSTPALDLETGLLTRKLTNATPSTPSRVVMNSAFPFFPQQKVTCSADDTRRHSCPILCAPIAAPATQVMINPKPEVATGAVVPVKRPAANRRYSADLTTGVLSRADTIAAQRQHRAEVLRTVMNQSYPIFLNRDSINSIQLGTAQTAIRVRPRLIKGKQPQLHRHSLPVIREVATPPSTSAGESFISKRKDSCTDAETLPAKDLASPLPGITFTAPSVTASNSTRSATTATDAASLPTTTDLSDRAETKIDALLASTVTAPVHPSTASASIGDAIAACTPVVPTGPSGPTPRHHQQKKLIKRRPVYIAPSTASSTTGDMVLSGVKGHDKEGKTHHPLSFASRMASKSSLAGKSSMGTKAKLRSKKSLRLAASESQKEMALKGREVPRLVLPCQGGNGEKSFEGEVWRELEGRI